MTTEKKRMLHRSLLVLLVAAFGQQGLPLCWAQRDDYLPSSLVPVEPATHCVDGECDDSVAAAGTGHVLSRTLPATDAGRGADWTAERCFSFCSYNTTVTTPQGRPRGLSVLEDIYRISRDACVDMQEVYTCLSACLYSSLSVLEVLNITSDSSGNTTSNCSDLCSKADGICDRAFPTQAPSAACPQNTAAACRSSGRCQHYCKAGRELHNQELTEIPLPAEVDGALSLQLVSPDEDFGLYSQGVMRVVGNRTVLSDLLDHYGIIWRVTSTQNHDTFYFSQHLPFLLSPGEVGSLYRAGSNMMAVQQLQCRQGLQLSYALVSQSTRTNFSEPTDQCFFGNGFLRPPSGIHVKFAFKEESSDLTIEIRVDNLSPDHSRVTHYGVQIYDSGHRLTKRAMFPNRDSLNLVLVGDETDGVFEHTSTSRPKYRVGVYALPQRNVSLSGRILAPASNWATVDVVFPFFPQFNTTSCFIATYNRTTARAALEFRLAVHSGWLSLAPLVSIAPTLVLEKVTSIPGFGDLLLPIRTTDLPRVYTQVNISEYKFAVSNVQIPEGHQISDVMKFQVRLTYIPGISKLPAMSSLGVNITGFRDNTNLATIQTCPEVIDPTRDSSGRRTAVLQGSLVLSCLIPVLLIVWISS